MALYLSAVLTKMHSFRIFFGDFAHSSLREEIFAEFNFADEQFSDKGFCPFWPSFSEKEKKNQISRNLISRIGPKSQN